MEHLEQPDLFNSTHYPLPHVSAINWRKWNPTENAVLLYIIMRGRILLIHKKTGIGKGLINGPGGRIEPKETSEEAVVREVKEEIGVHPMGVELKGSLKFRFPDGFGMAVDVFTANGHIGTLEETASAKPFWCPIAEIPYDDMWDGDRLWMPLLFTDVETFNGYFHFNNNKEVASYQIICPDTTGTVRVYIDEPPEIIRPNVMVRMDAQSKKVAEQLTGKAIAASVKEQNKILDQPFH